MSRPKWQLCIEKQALLFSAWQDIYMHEARSKVYNRPAAAVANACVPASWQDSPLRFYGK